MIIALKGSRSAAILPMFIVAIDTGIRSAELKNLRHNNLLLVWENGVIKTGVLTVGKSKTAAGTGRTIPLTQRACAALTKWISRFPNALPEHYLFPRARFGFSGFVYDLDPTRPIGDFSTAWSEARKTAKVHCRWHDLRHTFVSRLAEKSSVSEETIRSLAGHVSRQMLQRYSHIRMEAKRGAIAALEQERIPQA